MLNGIKHQLSNHQYFNNEYRQEEKEENLIESMSILSQIAKFQRYF